MSNNLAELIDHAITLSDELNLILSFHYTKENIRFMFMKNDMSIGWDFSLLEIENIICTDKLCQKLTHRVYELLDKIPRN